MSDAAASKRRVEPGGPQDRRDRPVSRVPLRAADAKRSVKNILDWNSYLPIDCVKTMVRLGWDYQT
jgi:hypothetical protein